MVDMNKSNKCKKLKGFNRTFCKFKKQVCKKQNHEIAKAGAKLYSFFNPAHAIVVPITEVSSDVVKEVIC